MSENQAAQSKDAFKNIVSYHAVREFSSQPVSEESLNRILRAGRWSGSAKNVQPWQFIVLRDRETINQLAKCGLYAQHLLAAPLAIVVVSDPVRLASFDAGRAAQNMMLAGWAEGIGSAMATMHDQACAKAVLGVPEEKQIEIVLDFGYPAPKEPVNDRPPGSARKDLNELVHWDRW